MTKTRITILTVPLVLFLLIAAATGNIRLTQIRSSDLQGNGTKFQTTSVSSPTANSPAIFDSGGKLAAGTRSGDTTVFGTTSGTLTSGNCVKFDASGNLVDNGAVCGGAIGASGTQFWYQEDPPTSSWSWVNQNGSTVTTVRNALTFQIPQINGTGGSLYVRTAPSPAWTLTAKINFMFRDNNYYNHAIVARESGTGKFVSCGVSGGGASFRYARWDNPGTTSANTDVGMSTATHLGEIYLRLYDDNSDLVCQWGDGYNFYTIDTQGRTAFMAGGADQIGIMGNKNNAIGTYDYVTLLSWFVE